MLLYANADSSDNNLIDKLKPVKTSLKNVISSRSPSLTSLPLLLVTGSDRLNDVLQSSANYYGRDHPSGKYDKDKLSELIFHLQRNHSIMVKAYIHSLTEIYSKVLKQSAALFTVIFSKRF